MSLYAGDISSRILSGESMDYINSTPNKTARWPGDLHLTDVNPYSLPRNDWDYGDMGSKDGTPLKRFAEKPTSDTPLFSISYITFGFILLLVIL